MALTQSCGPQLVKYIIWFTVEKTTNLIMNLIIEGPTHRFGFAAYLCGLMLPLKTWLPDRPLSLLLWWQLVLSCSTFQTVQTQIKKKSQYITKEKKKSVEEQSKGGDLIEPLVSVYSHLCSQRFGQDQDVTWYSTIRPTVIEKNTRVVKWLLLQLGQLFIINND